jgi:serpin B
MTLNGAAGDTRDQIREMLGFGSLSTAEVNASYRDLMAMLGTLDPLVELAIGNALFHRNSFQMEAPFLDAVRDHFGARVEGLDFDDPGAAGVINAWVREATENRIDDIVAPPIDPLTVALLLNAIYFKGDWTKRFDAADTYSGPFHLRGGGTEDVRFMVKEDTLAYRSSDAWQAVEIPYGGGAWAMLLAVPRGDHSIDDLVPDLATLLDPAAVWTDRVVPVHIPRFELEWERLLNDDLRALGMVDAFDATLADFTPLYSRAREDGLHVQNVKQKTFLKVDEVGTEAAAVTVVEFTFTSVGESFVVKADRPFLMAIRERLSGTVLFAGLIVQAPVE